MLLSRGLVLEPLRMGCVAMIDPLGLINGSSMAQPPVSRPAGEANPTDSDFGAVMKAEMERVDELQESAQAAAEECAVGRGDDIESVLFAAREADTAFQMLQQVRSKVLAAYEEVKQLRT